MPIRMRPYREPDRPVPRNNSWSEADGHRFALRSVGDLVEGIGLEGEGAGDEDAWHRRERGVVGEDGIVVMLAGEGDPVLGRAEFLLKG